MQHEIIPRLSANVSARRVASNFTVTDNTLAGPEDFRSYTMTVLTDARLPNSGQTIELFDINPALLGATNNFVTPASNFGKWSQDFNGWDLLVDARLRNGLLLCGGVAIGNTSTDNCEVAEQVPRVSSAFHRSGFRSGPRAIQARGGVDTAAILSPVDGISHAAKAARVARVAVVGHPHERDVSEPPRECDYRTRDLHRCPDSRGQPLPGRVQFGRSGASDRERP